MKVRSTAFHTTASDGSRQDLLGEAVVTERGVHSVSVALAILATAGPRDPVVHPTVRR